MDKRLREDWKENQQSYLDRAAEEVGEWISDYEKHPDTGAILADNGFYSNDEEIEEKAEEMYIDDMLDLLPDPFTREDIEQGLKENNNAIK